MSTNGIQCAGGGIVEVVLQEEHEVPTAPLGGRSEGVGPQNRAIRGGMAPETHLAAVARGQKILTRGARPRDHAVLGLVHDVAALTAAHAALVEGVGCRDGERHQAQENRCPDEHTG